jgi:hypothetical protein
MPVYEKHVAVFELLVDGRTGQEANNNIRFVTGIDPSFHHSNIWRADVWIWHTGLDYNDVATTDTVHILTGTETTGTSPWSFNNTATLADPFLLLDIPAAHQLHLTCAATESVKVKIKYIIRNLGLRSQ